MTDFSEIGRRSKRRGKTYERRVAKLLTEYTNYNFRKVPASGGFNKTGGVTIREELFCGDVISDNPNFKFCIEAKNRKIFTFESILKNPETSPFSIWWHQCCDDAKRVKLNPLLFFKPDSQADFVAVRPSDFEDNLKSVPHFALSVYTTKPLSLKIKDGNKTMLIETVLVNPYIINWKDFIAVYKPEVMFNGVLRQE